jgi:hypothetical protein
MKQFLLIVSLFLITSSVMIAQGDSTLSTSSEKTREVFIGGGISYPYLPVDFKNTVKNGWNVAVGYGFSFDPGSIGYGAVYASMELTRFPFNRDKYRAYLDTANQGVYAGESFLSGPAYTFNFMLNFKGTFSTTKQSVAPYFLVGVGYMNATVSQLDNSPDSTLNVEKFRESAFAWTFGVGIEAPINESSAIFVQAKSLLGVFKEARQNFPVTAGIRFRL